MTKTFDSAFDMVAVERPESPVFCLRPHVLRERARAFVEAFPGEVLYAVKCNDDRRVLRALYDGGVRHFDTASLAEVAAINDQFGQMTCHFMHPVKSRNAVAEAYHRYNVRTFALDDLGELAKIEEMLREMTASQQRRDAAVKALDEARQAREQHQQTMADSQRKLDKLRVEVQTLLQQADNDRKRGDESIAALKQIVETCGWAEIGVEIDEKRDRTLRLGVARPPGLDDLMAR